MLYIPPAYMCVLTHTSVYRSHTYHLSKRCSSMSVWGGACGVCVCVAGGGRVRKVRPRSRIMDHGSLITEWSSGVSWGYGVYLEC